MPPLTTMKAPWTLRVWRLVMIGGICMTSMACHEPRAMPVIHARHELAALQSDCVLTVMNRLPWLRDAERAELIDGWRALGPDASYVVRFESSMLEVLARLYADRQVNGKDWQRVEDLLDAIERRCGSGGYGRVECQRPREGIWLECCRIGK
jgi:hypothetical protein